MMKFLKNYRTRLNFCIEYKDGSVHGFYPYDSIQNARNETGAKRQARTEVLARLYKFPEVKSHAFTAPMAEDALGCSYIPEFDTNANSLNAACEAMGLGAEVIDLFGKG